MHHDLLLPLIKKLFNEPEIAFIQIKRENQLLLKGIFKKYIAFILSILIFISVSKYAVNFSSIGHLLKKGLIQPVIMMFGFMVLLYLLSVVIEESANYFGSRAKHSSGFKVCFLSAMPSLGMLPFTFLPIVGRFIFTLAVLYWVYLMWIGSKTLLFFPGTKLSSWVISIVFSCILALLLIYIFFNVVGFLFRFF